MKILNILNNILICKGKIPDLPATDRLHSVADKI